MEQRRSKTSKAIDAFAAGDYKTAMKIMKDFGKVFNRAEIRTLQIAYESLTGKAIFYQALGHDTDTTISAARALIVSKYPQLNSSNNEQE